MTDICRVFVVGNFAADIMRHQRDNGTCYGTTTLCVGRTDVHDGLPVLTTVNIPVVVVGTSRVASVAQQFGAGSRVLVEGHLELYPFQKHEVRSPTSTAERMRVDAVQPELVLVVDTMLNAATTVSAPEAQQQPARIAWQEQSKQNI